MSWIDIALCTLAVVFSSSAQMIMKTAAIQQEWRYGVGLVALSASLMLFSTIVAVFVLRNIELSQLIPFAALAYILVPLMARVFFKDTLSLSFWVGNGLIITGIILAVGIR